jgi:hypothetical protein
MLMAHERSYSVFEASQIQQLPLTSHAKLYGETLSGTCVGTVMQTSAAINLDHKRYLGLSNYWLDLYSSFKTHLPLPLDPLSKVAIAFNVSLNSMVD